MNLARNISTVTQQNTDVHATLDSSIMLQDASHNLSYSSIEDFATTFIPYPISDIDTLREENEELRVRLASLEMQQSRRDTELSELRSIIERLENNLEGSRR